MNDEVDFAELPHAGSGMFTPFPASCCIHRRIRRDGVEILRPRRNRAIASPCQNERRVVAVGPERCCL